MAINWRNVKRRALRCDGRSRTLVAKKNAVRADERRDGCSIQHRAPAIILPPGVERQTNAIHACMVAADVHADLLRIGGMCRRAGLTDNVGRHGEQQGATWQSKGTKQPRTSPGWKKDKPAFYDRLSARHFTAEALERQDEILHLVPGCQEEFSGALEPSWLKASKNGRVFPKQKNAVVIRDNGGFRIETTFATQPDLTKSREQSERRWI
jgi:hypothetical protein